MADGPERPLASSRPSILIMNANSTESMTQGLRELLEGPATSPDTNFTYTYMTAPKEAPDSIDNEDDAQQSLEAFKKVLTPGTLSQHAAFVVACYSEHPLEAWLREQKEVHPDTVLGILAASAIDSVLGLGDDESGGQGYGIVSTGKIWEELLPAAIKKLATDKNSIQIPELDDNSTSTTKREAIQTRFRGVCTTGLTAVQLHETDPAEVERRMVDATVKLVKGGDVSAVCLGCAGMAGMDKNVREGCIKALGKEKGQNVRIVDGTKSAVELLQKRLKSLSKK